MNQQAAQQFLSWLTEQHDQLIPLFDALQKDPKRAAQIYTTLEKHIAPRLEEVQSGLEFEMGPGSRKANALILSAGGMQERAQSVRYLSQNAPDLERLEIIAFKPARTVPEDHVHVIGSGLFGRKKVVHRDVKASISAEAVLLGVRLYFDGYAASQHEAWGQLGFTLLDFALGEERVMECVGEVDFGRTDEAEGPLFPLTELSARFEAARKRVIADFEAQQRTTPEVRAARALTRLASDIGVLREAMRSGVGPELCVGVTFWSKGNDLDQRLSKSFPEFDVESEARSSAVGDGKSVTLIGNLPRAGLDLETWVRTALLPLLSPEDALLAISEAELPNPMAAVVMGSTLLKEQRFDEAIRWLKRAVAANRGGRPGLAEHVLAQAYYKAGRYEEAERAFAIASTNEDGEMRGEALTNRGSALQRLGRLPEAAVCYESALALDDTMASRHYNLGQARYLINRDEAAALRSLTRALELRPELFEHMRQDRDLEDFRKTASWEALTRRLAT